MQRTENKDLMMVSFWDKETKTRVQRYYYDPEYTKLKKEVLLLNGDNGNVKRFITYYESGKVCAVTDEISGFKTTKVYSEDGDLMEEVNKNFSIKWDNDLKVEVYIDNINNLYYDFRDMTKNGKSLSDYEAEVIQSMFSR